MKFLGRLTVYQDFTPRSAAMNMAIDEALLETAKIPSIRFYRWNSPALSFGYFGRFADVADYAVERDLVRRWTGGGIVFHGDDLTYSIIIPAQDAVFAQSSMSIYEKIHRALRNALAANGERAELAVAAAPQAFRVGTIRDRSIRSSEIIGRELNATVTDRRYNECFANPVRADIMLNGRKVAGAAQRRTRAGLLHQGSIQHVDRGNGLAERFVSELSNVRSEKLLSRPIVERASEIAERKYATQNWLRRR
jgi:lipoate-protein ligase A